MVRRIPKLADCDMTALTEATLAQYLELPAEDLERLALLADAQGGFPCAYEPDPDGLHVIWADIEVAFVRWDLILRSDPPQHLS